MWIDEIDFTSKHELHLTILQDGDQKGSASEVEESFRRMSVPCPRFGAVRSP